MINIQEFFKQVGVDYADYEQKRKKLNRWSVLARKKGQYEIFKRFTDPRQYASYWPNDPNPEPLTKAEADEYSSLTLGHDRLHKLLQTEVFLKRARLKVLKETNAVLELVEETDEYLQEHEWDWLAEAKKLISKDYILSEVKVRLEKDRSGTIKPGSLFRLAYGLGSRLHRVISVNDDETITYEPAGFTNYGFMLIKPRSKRPTTETLSAFLQRGCRFYNVLKANEPNRTV